MDIYEGGIPQSAGKNTFPKASSEGENSGVPGAGGLGRVETKNGGPAVNSGGNTGKSFLDQAGYDTGNLNIDNEPSMKVVNPDDIQTS